MDKMANKQENTNTKKYDKFAIWSFIFGIISAVIYLILLNLLISFTYANSQTIDIFGVIIFLIYLLGILSIIFGLISTYRIHENKNLKGKMYVILGIVISILIIFGNMFILVAQYSTYFS